MAKTSSRRYVQLLEVADVQAIRLRLAESELGRLDFGAVRPVQANLLDSAVSRQEVSFGGKRKYERINEIAATLFFGIASNHAFENGNKRTALVSALVLLDRNSYDLVETTEDELFDMATEVVAHTFPIPARLNDNPDAEVLALSSWLRSRIALRSAGDKSMEFPMLRKMLTTYGCTFDTPVGNYMTVHRGSVSVRMGYPREKFTVPVQEVKHVRKILGLDEVDGGRFYDLDLAVDGFVLRHRDVLRRLADA